MQSVSDAHKDQIELATAAADIERIVEAHRIAVLLRIEGGHTIDDDLPVLRIYYRLGIRSMTLTQSRNTNWADSASDTPLIFDSGERTGGKNMANLKYTRSKGTSLLLVAAIVLCAMTAVVQTASDKCRPAGVIPLASEPPAKIVIDPPLAGPLASRGVAIIQYCTENLHLVPVFGPNALAVSPRVGHLHVRLDDAPWVWADASTVRLSADGAEAPPGDDV
ncbi:MAG: dipeptidase [Acidobacteriia bacterium]|nr:dipeptidase [Terriglobia bacterium]